MILTLKLIEKKFIQTFEDEANTQNSIFGNDDNDQLVISSRLDNLGKGASGAAIQSMNIALGYNETLGL